MAKAAKECYTLEESELVVEAEVVQSCETGESASAKDSGKDYARDRLKEELLARMSQGATLTEIFRTLDGVSFATVWRWRQADKAFNASYIEARKAMSDALVDDALDRVKLAKKDDWQAAHAYSQRAAWYASKMLPKLYGDQPAQVNIDNRTVTVVLSDEKRLELQERLARLQIQDNESKESNNQGG